MRDVSVKSAARILDLLELLAVRLDGIRVNEVARQLGIPKSSASSLLATLQGRGYVESSGDGFRLADRLRDGWVGGDQARLMRISAPVMKRLVARIGESAFLGVMTPDHRVRYVAKEVGDSPLRYDVAIGTERPAWCTSIGQVLLAGQDDEWLLEYLGRTELRKVTPKTVTDRQKVAATIRRVRRQRYALTADSHVLGASGVAAPVVDSAGRILAGLAVIAPSFRFDEKRDVITEAVSEAAAETSQALEHGGIRRPS
jgi:IclR family pca regulon transcriptional regulator